MTSILFATDLGARCDRALDRAVLLAAAWSARLVVVHAIQDPLPVSEQPSWRQADPLATARKRVADDVGRHPEVAIDVLVERAEPVDLILKVAEQRGCELIITGMARDETLGRIFLGTTVDALVRRATVPVLVVKSRPRAAYRQVVVATDFSEGARSALETTLAMLPEAQITLFHAFDVSHEVYLNDRMAARSAAKQRALDECQAFINATPAAVAARTRITTLCEYGEPGALLRDMIDARGVQLVVLGTAGRSGLAGVLLGSTASRLTTGIPVDVMLVHRRRNPV